MSFRRFINRQSEFNKRQSNGESVLDVLDYVVEKTGGFGVSAGPFFSQGAEVFGVTCQAVGAHGWVAPGLGISWACESGDSRSHGQAGQDGE